MNTEHDGDYLEFYTK